MDCNSLRFELKQGYWAATTMGTTRLVLHMFLGLVEAFLYDRAIDGLTYQEPFDRLNDEIALAEINELHRIEELVVQAAVSFGEFVLFNVPRLWAQLSSEQKQQLQQAVPPRGVEFEDGVYRAAETSMVFINLESKPLGKADLVALTGIEPVFQP